MFTLSMLYVNKLQAAQVNPNNEYSKFATLDDVASGQLLFESPERLKTNKGEKRLYQPAVLVNSSADFEINGIIASVTLTQSFLNNSDTIANGLYTFPLPENSAVNFLKIRIGNRTIEGKITEKNEARKLFKQAQQQGKKASLVEQHRPNLFTNKIANIAPNEQITVTIKYVQHVEYDKGQFSLRFPMTITPRYSPIATIPISNKNNSIVNNIPADERSMNTNNMSANHLDSRNLDSQNLGSHNLGSQNNQVVSYLSHIASLQSNNIQLAVNLHAGLPLDAITSPSHTLTTTQSSQNELQYQVSVGHVQVPMDKDFVLRWRPTPKSTPQLSVVHQNLDNETYAVAMLLPPTLPTTNQAFARDVTFIIDTSGSMQGSSIEQAKQSLLFALNTLSEHDSFNIIAFESTSRNLFNTTMMATQDNITKAKTFISRLSADGGTEMFQPLSNALSMQQTHLQDEDAIKQILFITDGAVSNEKALFKLISNTAELPRLFTVGIGSAPNGYFMRKAAQFGQGSYTYIGNINDVEEKMSNLLSKISRPALKNIQVNFHPLHVGSLEQYPNKIPDLYADEPLIVAFKTTVMPSSIQLFGELTNQPWQQKIKMRNQAKDNDSLNVSSHSINNGITSIWARAKIEDLLDNVITGKPASIVKPLVINTSIQHQVMSPFTSFLAIETEVVEPLEIASADSRAKELAHLQKAKSTNRAQKSQLVSMMAAPFPKTAVGWFGQLLIGLLMLALSLFTLLYTRNLNSNVRIHNDK
jgi:Ca-activated chloride channel family protein